jgi:hypothetical protein
MYIQARHVYQQKQPREERTLKYLLKLEDPAYRWAELEKAITPGIELKDFPGATHDVLWTTPQRLYK